MRKLWVLGLALACAGCAGVKYAMDEYSGITVQEVVMPNDTYRVFDKPAQNKMMVTSSLGSAALQGVGSGLFFGMVDQTPPKALYDAAALEYLRQTGRPDCRVVDSALIVKPQFEVKYDCTRLIAPAVQTPSGRRSRGRPVE